LSELLADKACLLILDDVWEAKHAEAFDVLGPCCRMLITTRDAGLIVALGAVEHRVDVLSDEQALTLLAEWAGQGVESLPAEAHEVAWECGNLPLALAMTGAMVRGKPDRWGNVLHKLRNADLEKIRQQFPHYPYPNLLRVIQVSVEALEPEVQARYLDFAVFPEDTPIPEAVLEMFWEPEGLGAYNVQDVVDVLVDRSLARRDAAGSLNPHDLQFDYVRRQAEDLPALHDRLLRAYAARCPGDWPTGPDDGYFFEHLVYHLVEAGREMDEILSLVENPTWRRARRREDVAGSSLAQDIERLCRAAERGGLSTLVQYIAASLLKAILRSQITNLPVETVEAFARLGHFDQALSLTRLMVGEVPRVTALWRLGQWCLERGRLGAAADLLKEARAGILALEKDKEKPRHLARLASHFSQAKRPDEAQRSLGMAFELLDTLENEAEQGRALDALVYGMRDHDAAMLEAWLAEAERAARQIERIHSYRALALARIAEQFHRIDAEHARTLVQEALCILSSAPASYAGEGISGIVFSQRDAFLATTIGIAVQIGLENEALGLLQTIQDSAARVTAYAELGRAYADQQRTKKAENYLRQALTVAETELEGVAQDSFKCQLVNLLLRISQVDQTQQVANSIQDQTERVYAFCAIAEHLGRDGRSEEARDWIEQMAVEWGGAFGKAAIGAALIKSDPDSALP
jgi:tetratricopeptide (TPR) repeat protein